MADWLQKPHDWYNAVLNVCSSVGPFLISQSDRSSEALARHKGRMARAEASRTLMVREADSIASVRDLLRKKYIDASPEERIGIRRDIADAEADIRHLQTATQALEYLPEFVAQHEVDAETQQSGGDAGRETESVSEHWMDRFNQLARAKNEPWRQDLLARALAAESATPGSINARALWVIGTLEESKFEVFATLLDIASVFSGGYVVPGRDVVSRKIPHCTLGDDVSIGSLLFQLGDTGLVADLDACRELSAGSRFVAAYDEDHVYHIGCEKSLLIIHGILPSTVGSAIAAFYERRHNPFGVTLLHEWVQRLDPTYNPVSKHCADGTVIACTKGDDAAA